MVELSGDDLIPLSESETVFVSKSSKGRGQRRAEAVSKDKDARADRIAKSKYNNPIVRESELYRRVAGPNVAARYDIHATKGKK
jgi:hypothetical protein